MSDHSPHGSDLTEVIAALRARGTDVVRLSYSDLMGVDRGRDMLIDELPTAIGHGLAFCRAVFHTSPMGDVVPVPGGLENGLPDVSVRPDLATLTPMPWEEGVAWVIGDVVRAGRRAPLRVARGRCCSAVALLAEHDVSAWWAPSWSTTCSSRTRPPRAAGAATPTPRATSTWSAPRATPAAPAHDAAAAARRRPAGHRRQPRVLRRPVRDQPEPLRARWTPPTARSG